MKELIIGGRKFTSRFFLGTGKFASAEQPFLRRRLPRLKCRSTIHIRNLYQVLHVCIFVCIIIPLTAFVNR